MINQQLLDYIRKQRAAGFSKQDITTSLGTAGWLIADINVAFAQTEETPPAPSLPSVAAPPPIVPPIIQPQSAAGGQSTNVGSFNNP